MTQGTGTGSQSSGAGSADSIGGASDTVDTASANTLPTGNPTSGGSSLDAGTSTDADTSSEAESDTLSRVFDVGAGTTDGATDSACCTNTGMPGCDDVLIEMCVCELDNYCCETIWDTLCAARAMNECQLMCSMLSDCCVPQIEPGCSDPVVEACVCDLDGMCCDVAWDPICVAHADNNCQACSPIDGAGG